ncbi:ABC transporter permease [Pasteurella sp. PK-2025]|uniref:ABC transporter permease n=1 Tax=unclassified Pasteurella TaxID=2621516 RepID=UPI003C75C5C0
MLLLHGKPHPRFWLWAVLDYLWGVFATLGTIFLCLALWQFTHQQMGSMVMPAPQAVLHRVYEITQGAERANIMTTLWRGCFALLLAMSCGSLLGFMAGLSKTMALLLRPINTILLGIPPIIWIVLALFWFNMGDTSVIFTVWIVVLPFVFAAAQMSLCSVPTDLIEVMKVYRIPFSRQLTQLYCPYIFRQMLPALIVAVGSGLKVTVMAELLGSNDGMGSAIANARAMLDTTDVMAYVLLIISLIMLIEYGVLEPIRRYVLQGENDVKTE